MSKNIKKEKKTDLETSECIHIASCITFSNPHDNPMKEYYPHFIEKNQILEKLTKSHS
jgi:hypothetical protein